MEFVVSIVTYNSIQHIEDLLSDIAKYLEAPNVRIVFHDNGSSDGTVDYISNNKTQFMDIIEGTNIGFGSAHNVVFSQYDADMYFLLNPDCRISSRILEELSVYKNIDIAAPNVFSGNGKPQKNYYDNHTWLKIMIYETINFLNIGFISERFKSKNSKNNNNRIACDWLSGCALFISKNVVAKLSGFDSNIFLYAEDEEICWRARNNGFKVEKLNIGHLTHYVGWNENWKSKKLRDIMYKSHAYVYKKMYKNNIFTRNMMLSANLFRFILRRLK